MGSAFSVPGLNMSGAQQIGQVICSGSQSTITFTGIPSNYSDLMIVFSGRATGAVAAAKVYIKLNSDGTAANYLAAQYVDGIGSGAAAGTVASTTSGGYAADVAGTSTATNPITTFDLVIPAYAGTVLKKAFRVNQYTVFGASDQAEIVVSGSQWLSTAAITRIDLTIVSGSFLDGTTCTLYGLGTGPSYSRGYDEGTVFPTTNLVTNRKFYRTDLNLLCYYDGTRWLTVNEYTSCLQINSNSVTVSATGDIGFSTIPGDYAIYVTTANAWVVTAATNNSSNKWTYAFKWGDSAGTATTLGSAFDTGSDTAGTRVVHNIAINTALTTSALALTFTCTTKTGTPGNGTIIAPVVRYRLIVT